MKDTLLSVVIPTRNRQKLAATTIKLFLDTFPREGVQLVVVDNSEDQSLRLLLDSLLTDPRLVYCYDDRVVSSVDNFRNALELAAGEFVVAIGDDDFVNPELMTLVDYCREADIDSVCDPYLQTRYFWPDLGNRDGGQLRIPALRKAKYIINPRHEILYLLVAGACLGIQKLPKVYFGLVKRSVLKKAIVLSKQAQLGTCPDMYFAVLCAKYARTTLILHYPLFVPGASVAATSGDWIKKKDFGELTTAPHLRGRPDFQWEEIVPCYYSVTTFWAESFISAVRLAFPKWLWLFNEVALRRYLARRHGFLFVNRRSSHRSNTSVVEVFWELLGYSVALLRRIQMRFEHSREADASKYSSLVSSVEALGLLSKHLASRGYSLESILKSRKCR